jgi:hypothetical protein
MAGCTAKGQLVLWWVGPEHVGWQEEWRKAMICWAVGCLALHMLLTCRRPYTFLAFVLLM